MTTLREFFMGYNNLPHYTPPPTPAKRKQPPFKEALNLLRDLADLQNGPPLVKYEKEYNEIMEKVYAFLNTHEKTNKVHMIQSNELRIGNLVTVKGIICPIILVSETHIRVRLAERETAVNKDEIEPIPLTKELLKQYGFNIAEGTNNEIRVGRFVMRLTPDGEKLQVSLFIGNEYLGYRSFLHELQNFLYSVWGTELTSNARRIFE